MEFFKICLIYFVDVSFRTLEVPFTKMKHFDCFIDSLDQFFDLIKLFDCKFIDDFDANIATILNFLYQRGDHACSISRKRHIH